MVLLKDFNVFDDEQLKRAVSRSNLVINLLGMDKETMNFTFEDVHIEAARKIAMAASNNGLLERYLHVSCLAAAPDHPSRRLRSKVNCPQLSVPTTAKPMPQDTHASVADDARESCSLPRV